MNTSQGKLVIFSAPSGSGKSTLVQYLLKEVPGFTFSISATSRAPRGTEKDGVDYYFISNEAFQERVAEEAFLEWEEVYPGTCYGTLKNEVEKSWETGNAVGFDIDVVGGKNLKALYGEQALALFIQAPSIEELERRLIARGTDSNEKIKQSVRQTHAESIMRMYQRTTMTRVQIMSDASIDM